MSIYDSPEKYLEHLRKLKGLPPKPKPRKKRKSGKKLGRPPSKPPRPTGRPKGDKMSRFKAFKGQYKRTIRLTTRDPYTGNRYKRWRECSHCFSDVREYPAVYDAAIKQHGQYLCEPCRAELGQQD